MGEESTRGRHRQGSVDTIGIGKGGFSKEGIGALGVHTLVSCMYFIHLSNTIDE